MAVGTDAFPDVDIGREVRLARCAQKAWGALPVRGRLRVLKALRHRIADRAGELVAAVDGTQHRRPGETLAAEVLPLAEACRFLERRAAFLLKPGRARGGGPLALLMGVSVTVRREPHGVVLVIGPANYPLFLPGAQAVQALAAGNAVVVKPGAGGLSAMRALADLLRAAGLDPCLFRVLPEPASAAKQAIEAGVDKVVLTGSADTGREVLADLAPRLVPAAMELSGCDAVFVLDDADLEVVARAVIFGLCLNGGATCIAPHRLFATPDVARRLESRLAELVRHAPHLQLAPGRASYAAQLIEEAVAQGARVIATWPEGDAMSGPVVVADATPQMRLLREDVFAPAMGIVPVEGMEEALRADEHCPYALGASVFGGRRAAERLAERIRAGCVVVNDVVVPTADPRVPFGGRDMSGFGVTRGAEGLLEMTVVKSVVVQRRGWRPHLRAGPEEAEGLLRLYLAAAYGRSLTGRLRALCSLGRAAWSRRRASREAQGEEGSGDG